MCRTAVDAEALWKRRPTKPISSTVPYYLFCLFIFLWVVMSLVSLMETQGLEQAQNDLVVWSEAHPEKWATNDHDCSPNHYAKKKPHASYTARARAAQRAIYFDIIYNFYFSVLCTNHNAHLPTIQSTVPVPLRPSAADCMILIQYGQYPSNAHTVYHCTCIQVWYLALACHHLQQHCHICWLHPE